LTGKPNKQNVHIASASTLDCMLLAALDLLICSEKYFGNLLICPAAGTPVRIAALLFVHYDLPTVKLTKMPAGRSPPACTAIY